MPFLSVLEYTKRPFLHTGRRQQAAFGSLGASLPFGLSLVPDRGSRPTRVLARPPGAQQEQKPAHTPTTQPHLPPPPFPLLAWDILQMGGNKAKIVPDINEALFLTASAQSYQFWVQRFNLGLNRKVLLFIQFLELCPTHMEVYFGIWASVLVSKGNNLRHSIFA